MRIDRVVLQNVKSFNQQTVVEFSEGLNVVIGSNAGGKSNLLEIVQALLNDLFFEDFSFSENNNSQPNEKIKPYKSDKRSPNNQHLSQNILEKFEGNNSDPQIVSIFLVIDKADIESLNALQSTKDQLIAFENEQVTSGLFAGTVNSIDFDTDYSSLVGQEIEIRIENQNITQPENYISDPIKLKFIKFLRQSLIIYKFINLYNNLTSNEPISFSPYFYYIPPNRETINLSNTPRRVDLTSNSGISTNHYSQTTITQDSRPNPMSAIDRILAENYASGKTSENETYRQLILNNLGLDFTIEKTGTIYHPIYEIKFSRAKRGKSVRLSSGEREILSFLTTIYVQQIKNGILFFDEPEIHLHPRWQKRLVTILKEVIKERSLQLVTVTHSSSFIRKDILNNLIRVYKSEDGSSEVVLADRKQLSLVKNKDIFLLISSGSNEKVFFSDKVILVEGPADRVIFEAILNDLMGDNPDTVIEVVETYGKNNLKQFGAFLDVWKIPYSIIADRDYLRQVGNEQTKSLFATDVTKIKDCASDKSSSDGKALINELIEITSGSVNDISPKKFESLKKLVRYIQLRHTALKEDLSDDEKKQIGEDISQLRSKNVFILSKGEIEDYFNKNKFDIDDVIEISKGIENKSIIIDEELSGIIAEIIKKP